MAIAAQWQTVATVPSTALTIYTSPTTAFAATAGTYGYQRDLVITNSGATFVSLAAGTAVTNSATTVGSFALPPGGTIILTQCQVPNGTVVNAIGPGQLSIGFGTNVSYI